LHVERVRLFSQVRDIVEGLRDHETARPGALDRIADCVEADEAHACLMKLPEDRTDVRLALLALNVDIDLMRSKRGPHQAVAAVVQLQIGEREPGAWTVYAQQVRFGRAVWKYAIHGQEEAGIR